MPGHHPRFSRVKNTALHSGVAKNGTEAAQWPNSRVLFHSRNHPQLVDFELVAEGGFEPPTKGL
jgi:hypothetical protein